MQILNTSAHAIVPPENPHHQRRPLLTPLPDPGHFLLVLDNSSLEGWKRCAMYARNQLVLERTPHARNAALAYGGAIHAALEVYLKGKTDVELTPLDGSMDTSDRLFFTRITQTIVNYFTDAAPPADDFRTVENAVIVMGEYIKRSKFPDYELHIHSDADGLAVERAFEIPLGVVEVGQYVDMPWLKGTDYSSIDLDLSPVNDIPSPFVSHIHVAWSGRIDLIATAQGKPRIIDHKTTSIDGEQFVQSFQLSSQTLGYVYAARTLFPDLDITSFCLDAIRLKRPGKGQGITDKGVRGGDPPLAFFRAYFDYSPDRIDRWRVDTLDHISNFIHALTSASWPMNDRHCFDKFGRCPYFDVCSIDDVRVRERYLQSDAFGKTTWNPVRN